MACAIIPTVTSRDGKKVDSRLFQDLLSFLSNNRKEAIRLYLITKNPKFIQEWNPKLKLDNNDEPTISSLLQKTDLKKFINESMVLEKLNRDIGHYEKNTDRSTSWIKNSENYKKLTDKARKFNSTSEFKDEYVARVTDVPSSESQKAFIEIRIDRRNKLYSLESEKMEYNEALNEKLKDILSRHGISVGVLTELEKRQGLNGVADFDKAQRTAEGMIELIRLANGIRGEKVLPEEFAHVALEMLGDNPISNRLINLIVSKDLAREIIGKEYENYYTMYKGDKVKLAKEAAGKLLAKHLLQAETIPAKPYRNLLQRLIESIKEFLKKLSASSIQRAMMEADKSFGTLAQNILNGSLDSTMSIDNIDNSDLYYSTTERVKRDRALLQKIIDNEVKRLAVYEKRTHNVSFAESQKEIISELESKLRDGAEIEGIYCFLDHTLEIIGQMRNKLKSLVNTEGLSANQKAKVLRDIRNYYYSYKGILRDIREALLEEEDLEDNRYGERVKVVLENTQNLLENIKIKYDKVAMPLFVDFIKPYVGDGITVPFGKYKGQTFTAEDIITKAPEDISFFDRWLDSMADSSNYALKIIDQIVKRSKEKARLRVIDKMKELQALGIKLELAGYKNTAWMFERDSQGNLTGRYISKINYGLFREATKKMLQRLQEKYGENPEGKDLVAMREEKKAWFKANMDENNGKYTPKIYAEDGSLLYGNADFLNLTDAQRDFYNAVMGIKAELDNMLPENFTTLTRAVRIRKDLVERVKASNSVKSGAKAIWEDIKDQFIRRSDDEEFGDRTTFKDFEDREVQMLPIYYTKLRKGENFNDLSTDVVTTMTAYAAMAIDYDEMNDVIHILEVGRDVMHDNFRPSKTRGDKPLIERVKAAGRTVENKVTKGGNNRVLERLDDYFEMQVYNRYLADEGTFGKSKIDKAKAANFLNKLTSINTIAINPLLSISNIATGKVMMRIESFCKEYFSPSNVLKADKYYGTALPAYLAEAGKRVKTSKLALWSELFNVMQDFEQSPRELKFTRSWFTRMFGTSALYILQDAGEHWLQHRTSLALADAYKMKAPNGKLVSLWDAMEVKYIDENNKALGAKLVVKEGYTKKDGTEFTEEDIYKFSRKSAAINQRMHGIYNKLDRSAVQRLALGRMAIMFRKWIKPSLNRRFKSAQKNFDLDSWTEGYYRTTGRFLTQLAKELRHLQFHAAANWRALTDEERANILRARNEVVQYLAIIGLLALIDWDDKNRPWLEKMIEYQLRRLKTEVGVMVPGKPMIDESLKIIKSPSAVITTIQSTLDLIGLLNPYNYGEDAIIESGQFKGKTKAYRLLMKSPFAPMRNTIIRGIDPDLAIPFFKN